MNMCRGICVWCRNAYKGFCMLCIWICLCYVAGYICSKHICSQQPSISPSMTPLWGKTNKQTERHLVAAWTGQSEMCWSHWEWISCCGFFCILRVLRIRVGFGLCLVGCCILRNTVWFFNSGILSLEIFCLSTRSCIFCLVQIAFWECWEMLRIRVEFGDETAGSLQI